MNLVSAHDYTPIKGVTAISWWIHPLFFLEGHKK